MTQNEEINELNTIIKVRLAPSKIHGVGVFAIRDIKEGEVLYCDRMPKPYKVPWGSLSKLFPEVREIVIERWASVINGSIFILPDARAVSFMNHADYPNYDPVTDTATKPIKKGEEVTENYTIMRNWQRAFPWLE